MAEPDNTSCISMCSFNCRSFKHSLPAINKLCNDHDIVLLQEHWLIPNDLHLLNSAHPDFLSCGQSAVDLSSNILVGRPYGGTAILYRKYLTDKIQVLNIGESRITGININSSIGPLLILNVYMPTNYNDDASFESYLDCLSKLHALILDTEAIHTLIVGDFNCSPGSKFFPEFVKFSVDNNLLTSDLNRLHDVATYISDDGCKQSWVDHILSSNGVDKLINTVNILYDVIVSDHRPISFTVQCDFGTQHNSYITIRTNSDNMVPQWSICDDATLYNYAAYLDNLLQDIVIPYDALLDNSRDYSFLPLIDKFYNDIIKCISTAIADVIPKRKRPISSFNVPGWNTFVQEKHEAAREAFLMWVDSGRPRFGYDFDVMKRTRALFKLALRHCKNNIEELKADACAESLFDKGSRKFWNNVYKISNDKATSHVNSVGGATGAHNVAVMWKNHFQTLYSVGVESKYRALFAEKLSIYNSVEDSSCLFSMSDIVSAMDIQKRGKAPGPDGINMEAFIFGGRKLNLYLSILFNLFLLYGYVPDAFHQATIIPLVKCKSGDLSDVNNYRAIALSNSITKILESLLFALIDSYETSDEYQFGFKSNHSTATCTHVFKKIVNHYRQHGSHVFACFIDFNKAFDNVDYWLLFCKLIDNDPRSKRLIATRLLAFWYSNQQMFIRWQNTSSESFKIYNGVRQGGLLSPYLFRFYIRNLIDRVTKLNVGCNYFGINFNLLAYADDMVLLAPSWFGLQSLLNVLESSAHEIFMSFNTKKTVCMVFNPSKRHKVICNTFPVFSLAGCNLLFVENFKYLGHVIDNCLNDDSDIMREVKNLFVRTNLLCRRFRRCSLQVKLVLFRSFCICFYDTALWSNFSAAALLKFKSCYHKCLKYFFGYLKYSSVTNMLLDLGLPSFNTLIHNQKVGFHSSLNNCDNLLVSCLISHILL